VKELFDQWLPQGSALRNIFTLASGATLGQLAVVLVSPLLTRIYTPEEFGVLAVYASLLGILSTISGFRYELAIVLPKTDGSAINILVLTVLSVFFTTALVAIIVVLFGAQISIPSMAPFLWLLPFGILLTGIYQAFNCWAIRRHRFNRIAMTKMQQGIGGAVTQVGLGLAHLGPLGLITGHIMSQGAGVVALIRGAYREDFSLIDRVRWQRIKRSARRYKRFPKYTTWSALANSSSTMLPVMLFAILFSPEVAGVYMLAHSAMHTPLRLIGNSIGQVFLAKAVESNRQGNLDNLVVTIFTHLLRLSIIPLIVTMYFAQDIFATVFGETWRQAGIYIQYMAPWLVLQFCVSSVSQVVTVLEKQAGLLVSQILFLITRIGIILVVSNLGLGSTELIASFSIISVVLYLGHFLWICSLLNIGYKGFVNIFVSSFWFGNR
jgi:O-antigen/teichoic acid export membrane protein